MISYYLPSGSKIGVGYQAHSLANELAARGHQVTVISGCGPTTGADYETETISLHGRNRTFRFALELRKHDWARFDVLHAHSDDYWLWKRRVPVHVRTLHGSCFSEALHIRGLRERLRMALLGFSEVLATRVADETVAVSRNTRHWTPWVRTVIPNGVDLSRLHPGEKSTSPSILFVGTYHRRKRGKFLHETFERDVRSRFPDAELWMVAEDARPGPGVTVFGRVSDAELAELYRRAWVFCLPSTYEGFGIPYAEAMASGCPVVATANPGALEVTDGGKYGMISEDLELGSDLVALLGNRQERERLAALGLTRVADYDLKMVASAYESVYARLRARASH